LTINRIFSEGKRWNEIDSKSECQFDETFSSVEDQTQNFVFAIQGLKSTTDNQYGSLALRNAENKKLRIIR
jgi:hypothetical protein